MALDTIKQALAVELFNLASDDDVVNGIYNMWVRDPKRLEKIFKQLPADLVADFKGKRDDLVYTKEVHVEVIKEVRVEVPVEKIVEKIVEVDIRAREHAKKHKEHTDAIRAINDELAECPVDNKSLRSTLLQNLAWNMDELSKL